MSKSTYAIPRACGAPGLEIPGSAASGNVGGKAVAREAAESEGPDLEAGTTITTGVGDARVPPQKLGAIGGKENTIWVHFRIGSRANVQKRAHVHKTAKEKVAASQIGVSIMIGGISDSSDRRSTAKGPVDAIWPEPRHRLGVHRPQISPGKFPRNWDPPCVVDEFTTGRSYVDCRIGAA
ncbi:hypothetical protein K438DRAFT_1756125 [Mycena galopus ATCC 62051]|nr:hypothetical protein K438DRAFT_1756125 [Mycena galopus ATCC 62051]